MPLLDPALLPSRPTTRFAPSPTGLLHLGHVANAVWTWGVASATGGRVILRLEDHDRTRCRPEFEAAILADLDWLGLEPDAGSRRSLASHPSPYRQSDNPARYQAAFDRLARAGLVYGCDCSRRSVARSLGNDAAEEGEELCYPGTCRGKGLTLDRAIRLRLPDRPVAFADLRLGALSQAPARQCGDLLLRDLNGNWTYQFAVVVDDLAHGVDLVVRGEDILPSTGRQILLGEALGWAGTPRYLHHPLIRNDAGVKLSKRDRATGLAALRALGRSRDEVLGLAAHASGLAATAGPIAPDQLAGLFR